MNIEIIGSHGFLIVNEAGRVTKCRGKEYRDIIEVDLAEYQQYYGQLDDSTDILDVGFWFRLKDGRVQYCPPEMEWRDEIRADIDDDTVVWR